MAADDKAAWTWGLWNGYVQAGQTRAERLRRLSEVPEHLRPKVEAHVRTVFTLMRRARQKQTESSKRI